MTNSQAIAVALAVIACTTGNAFVPPTPLNRPATSSPSRTCTQGQNGHQAPKSRGTTSAVGPLGAFSFSNSFSSFTSFFIREREAGTSLPQDPKADKAARKKQLTKQQKLYRWSTEGIPVGTPFLEGEPPEAETPSLPWITQIVSAIVKIAVGTIKGTVGVGEVIEALSSQKELTIFVSRIADLIKENPKTNERPTDIDDYVDLHAFPVKTPKSVYDYEDDDTFARLRLQGANCVVLEKCTQATRNKLNILDTDPSYAAMKTKVDSLFNAGKLFVVDHELLAGMPSTPVDDVPRYLAPSVALFEMVDDDLLPLKVIGIQLSQGEEATPIFTPEDGHTWMIAKACFEAADFIIHEIVSHLGNTHVVLEGPMVAMNRQLPKEHPIYDLLQPHLEGTAFINYQAQERLIVVGGAVDRLQANDIEDSWALVLATTLDRISKDFSPPADFEARQVTKKDFPGRYMYRDVGIQYWEATHAWVTEYLDLYYANDKDVEEDYELQAFIGEMTDIAMMKWMDDFKTTNDKKGLLAKVLASIIYTGSTLHAAVNFPQKPSMSFVPSCPGSVFAPIPTDKRERTFEDYMSYLPPMEIATTHTTVLTLLGSVFHTQLGDYAIDQFDDDRVNVPLAKFQQAIEDIETDLLDANAYLTNEWRKRGKDKKDAVNFAYTTLLPDYIPQSTNI